MSFDMRKVQAVCHPAHPGVATLLQELGPIFDEIPGLVGVETIFVLEEEDLRTPLAGLTCGLRTNDAASGVHLTQWTEKLDPHLPAATLFRIQQKILSSVSAAAAIEMIGTGCPNSDFRDGALRVFITRDAIFVSSANATGLMLTVPDPVPAWQRQLLLSVLPRQAQSNHERMELMARIESSFRVWEEAYTLEIGRYKHSYRVDIQPPSREDMEKALKV